MTCIVTTTTRRTWRTIHRRPSASEPSPFVGVPVPHLPLLLLIGPEPIVDCRRLLAFLDLRLQGRLGLLLLQNLILLGHRWETSKVCPGPSPIALGSLFLSWLPCRQMSIVVLVGGALFLDESRHLILW